MKTFKSIYLSNELMPDDSSIYDALRYVGYDGYLPKHFIADLIILGKCRLLNLPIFTDNNDYIDSVTNIINTSGISHWLRDTMYILKRISSKYNLRVIEELASNGKSCKINFEDIGFSFNYTFDINGLNQNIIAFLNITDEQLKETEKLPEEIIEVLSITSGLGSFLKTSKRIVSDYQQMTTYGSIVKIHKHNFADPLFNYKFSIKNYALDSEKVVSTQSNKMIIGYFLGNYKRQHIISLLIKLLGAIVLSNFSDNIKIIVYSFLIDTYSKKEISSSQDLIEYFSSPKQLKLFAIDNSKAIKAMITENPGDDIIFLPNVLGTCVLDNNYSGSNRVNMISVQEAEYNKQYENICKKTGGLFITV